MKSLNDYTMQYQRYLTEFEAYLAAYLKKMKTIPSVLGESMAYSLSNGGKRIRPVLALACADVLGVEKQDIFPYALAIEMIHAYSLVHDDLPAMDNDDFRRGKPSNHKVFGEANAILAGDALLNEAYAICFDVCLKGEKYAVAAKLLNSCAGINGMLAGQSADLYFSDAERNASEADLQYIHAHKTGKLLFAPLAVASILANNKNYFELEEFGKRFGMLFQIVDDILDVTGDLASLGKNAGKDEAENKLTYVRLYGLEGAKLRADMYAQECQTILEGVDGDTSFLRDLVDYVRRRQN